jgi:hypothetical protein
MTKIKCKMTPAVAARMRGEGDLQSARCGLSCARDAALGELAEERARELHPALRDGGGGARSATAGVFVRGSSSRTDEVDSTVCSGHVCVFRTCVCVFRTRAERSGLCSGRGCVLGTRVGEQACSCAGHRFGRDKTEAHRGRAGNADLGAEHVDDDRHDRRVPRAERERAPGAAL